MSIPKAYCIRSKSGYRYTNIYRVLKKFIPASDSPKIADIKYTSHRRIDLIMNPDVAITIAKSIGILTGEGVAAV
jgi:hypothetical protein